MNNDPILQRWRELAWRRRLTEAELAQWRAAHPEGAADADDEGALNDALLRLPDAPVPSNFTALVLQDLDREARHSATRARAWLWFWRVLVPRATVASLVVGVGVLAYRRHQATEMGAMRLSLVTVVGVQSPLGPQALEDFEVIRRLDTPPPADNDLLVCLQ